MEDISIALKRIEMMETVEKLNTLEENILKKGIRDPRVEEAISQKRNELYLPEILSEIRKGWDELTGAEQKIVKAITEYVAIKKHQGSNANRTLQQIRNKGLIGAAEASVSKSKPTMGYVELEKAGLDELSYEHIVLDHPEEFSARAVWYSKRTLGRENDQEKPPPKEWSFTQDRTAQLLIWLKARRNSFGQIEVFTNKEASAAMGMENFQSYARVQGNIQSRLDFICYQLGYPPIGLTAEKPFDNAWATEDREWHYPVAIMQSSAQTFDWSDERFKNIEIYNSKLPAGASNLWRKELAENEDLIKDWAHGFQKIAVTVEPTQQRNPIWSRDELILALDFYFRYRPTIPSKASEEILELSKEISQLAIFLGANSSETLRNTNGVYMKLMNFLSIDPEYTKDGKSGLQNSGKLEKELWDDFADDPHRLSEAAQLIRSLMSGDEVENNDEDTSFVDAEEGKLITRLHTQRERSAKIVNEKKKQFKKAHGKLFCEACKFEYESVYGERGKDYIECHHTKPVHTLQPKEKTRLFDLVLLCANCHRMVHAKKEWLSMEELRSLLSKHVRPPYSVS